MFPRTEAGAPDLFGVRLCGEGIVDFLQGCEYVFEAEKQIFQDPYMKAAGGRNRFGQKGRLRGKFDFRSLTGPEKTESQLPLRI